jgi:hypothetical protein
MMRTNETGSHDQSRNIQIGARQAAFSNDATFVAAISYDRVKGDTGR